MGRQRLNLTREEKVQRHLEKKEKMKVYQASERGIEVKLKSLEKTIVKLREQLVEMKKNKANSTDSNQSV